MDPTSPETLKAAGLTNREIELLPLLLEHRSFADIAEMLGLPRATVDSLALSIYRKLGVSPLSGVLEPEPPNEP